MAVVARALTVTRGSRVCCGTSLRYSRLNVVRPRLSCATGLVLIMLGLVACGTDRNITGGQPRGPEIPRTSLIVHVRLQPSDAALASTLGWESGVPGAEVNLLRNGTEDWLRLRTDPTGKARLANILPARYRVYAGRFLHPGGGFGGGASGSKLR